METSSTSTRDASWAATAQYRTYREHDQDQGEKINEGYNKDAPVKDQSAPVDASASSRKRRNDGNRGKAAGGDGNLLVQPGTDGKEEMGKPRPSSNASQAGGRCQGRDIMIDVTDSTELEPAVPAASASSSSSSRTPSAASLSSAPAGRTTTPPDAVRLVPRDHESVLDNDPPPAKRPCRDIRDLQARADNVYAEILSYERAAAALRLQHEQLVACIEEQRRIEAAAQEDAVAKRAAKIKLLREQVVLVYNQRRKLHELLAAAKAADAEEELQEVQALLDNVDARLDRILSRVPVPDIAATPRIQQLIENIRGASAPKLRICPGKHASRRGDNLIGPKGTVEMKCLAPFRGPIETEKTVQTAVRLARLFYEASFQEGGVFPDPTLARPDLFPTVARFVRGLLSAIGAANHIFPACGNTLLEFVDEDDESGGQVDNRQSLSQLLRIFLIRHGILDHSEFDKAAINLSSTTLATALGVASSKKLLFRRFALD